MKHCRQRRTALALGLAALAMGVAATNAHATAIRFDNPAHGDPGHFEWIPAVGGTEVLDVTLPVASQPGQPTDDSVITQAIIDATRSRLQGATAASLNMELGGFASVFVIGLNAGDTIPSGAPFGQIGWVVNPAGTPPTELPEGLETYVGVQFPIGGNTHNGWVGVVRTGLELETFAWGYETDPGVSIPAGAPEPGTLAMLAFGAAALLKRRRPHASQIDSQID